MLYVTEPQHVLKIAHLGKSFKMLGGVAPTESLKNSAVSSMLSPVYQDVLCTLNPHVTYKPMKTGIISAAL